MGGSIWYTQVNRALKTLIPTIVKTYNKDEVLVSVSALVRTPDPEFKVETYPCVTIYSYDEKFSQNRYTEGRVVTSINEGTLRATVEESAKPYSLFYQLDFWAKYQEDIDTMTMLWGSKFAKHNTIQITDSLGVIHTCYMKLVKIAKLDKVQNQDERIFQRVYSYEIWVELDESVPVEVPVALNTELVNKGGI
jgi:hypothetical protein